MLLNYFKIAFRNIFRNSFYSFISVVGLAVGITASALILLFVSHEYSFDKFHKNGEQAYRILAHTNWGGQEIQTTKVSGTFGPKLKEESPDVVDFVRTRIPGKILIQSDQEHRFFETQFLFTDPSLFRVFSFDILRGNPDALSQANTVFLTEETAQKYFGADDPVGKVITYDRENLFTVAGIVKKAPSNSTLQFNFIGSFSSLGTIAKEKKQYDHQNASLGAYDTYLQLRPGSTSQSVEYIISKIAQTSADEKYFLEPFLSIHLANNLGDTSNIKNIGIFLFGAVLVLLLALINYINLATARATQRAKEVGIRKTIGANLNSLRLQFYLESALVSVIAFTFAFILIELLTPFFLNTLQQDIDNSFLRSSTFLGSMAVLFVICIVFSGSYPAIVLSQFKPVDVLKGRFSTSNKSSWTRNGFTVFQFSVSTGLIICSLVIHEQLEYMKTKNLGLNKEQVLAIPLHESVKSNLQILKNDIEKQAGVISVGTASISLFETPGTSAYYTKTPTTHEDVLINVLSVDEDFFKTLGIEWVKKETDSIATGDYVINEAALEKLKISGEHLGQYIELGRDSSTIKGVVKDFNYLSLRQKLEGLVLSVEKDNSPSLTSGGGTLYVRFNPNTSVTNGLAAIKNIYDHQQFEFPFQYYFLDQAFDTLYKSEDRLLLIFRIFTGIAIFIACLGLYGLITFNAERRTKEIGIRKVLGASIPSIFRLLSWEYLLLIFISLLIASPLAWWSMNRWLMSFNYHIDLSILLVFYAGTAAFILAMVTISFRAIRAARSNPVDALRSE